MKSLKRIICFFLPALLLIIAACGSERHTDPDDFVWNARYDEYPITCLNFEDRYLYWENPIGLELNFLHDSEGVRITFIQNQYVYHPFTLATMGIQYASGYYVTRDSAYLDFCHLYINKLSEIGARFRGGIYFPYTFNYGLHNGNSNDVMMAPWFSGIAEGYTLTFISKYYEVTNDDSVMPFADSVFNTFLNTDMSAEIWTCMIDSLNYYWVEEYPYQPQAHVLGGFTSGIIGLYNYYLITGDSRCLILLNSALTTIENYFYEYRNPGDICYYCLLHKSQLGNYHMININRLRYLARISGDSIFDQYADSLEADYSGGSLAGDFEFYIEHPVNSQECLSCTN